MHFLVCTTVFGCFHLRSRLCSLAQHDRNILCCLAQLLHIVPGDADPLPQPAAARANFFFLQKRAAVRRRVTKVRPIVMGNARA